MFVTVTVKMEAESKKELSNMQGDFEVLQKHFDALWNEGVFGPPEQVEVRYLVVGTDIRKKSNAKSGKGKQGSTEDQVSNVP